MKTKVGLISFFFYMVNGVILAWLFPFFQDYRLFVWVGCMSFAFLHWLAMFMLFIRQNLENRIPVFGMSFFAVTGLIVFLPATMLSYLVVRMAE